jgi:hypothetical protein
MLLHYFSYFGVNRIAFFGWIAGLLFFRHGLSLAIGGFLFYPNNH